MTYEQIKQSLLLIQNPIDKLDMVMDLGKNLLKVPDSAVCTEILGCTSFVQLCKFGDKFYGTADSAMVRGILAIILAMIEGKSIKEIKQMDIMAEFQTLDLNFGAARLNGIQSMINFFSNL